MSPHSLFLFYVIILVLRTLIDVTRCFHLHHVWSCRSTLKSRQTFSLVLEQHLIHHSSWLTNIPWSSHPFILSLMYPLHRWKFLFQWCHTRWIDSYYRDFPSFSLYVFLLECHNFQFLIWSLVPMLVSSCANPPEGYFILVLQSCLDLSGFLELLIQFPCLKFLSV